MLTRSQHVLPEKCENDHKFQMFRHSLLYFHSSVSCIVISTEWMLPNCRAMRSQFLRHKSAVCVTDLKKKSKYLIKSLAGVIKSAWSGLMKGFGVLVLCMLVGCAGRPTMEQLETHALASGDWSAVESREKAHARRGPRASLQCPAGRIEICSNRLGSRQCSCNSRSALRNMLTGH